MHSPESAEKFDKITSKGRFSQGNLENNRQKTMTAAKKITSSNKSEDQPDVAYANNKSPKNIEFDVGNKRGSKMAKL